MSYLFITTDRTEKVSKKRNLCKKIPNSPNYIYTENLNLYTDNYFFSSDHSELKIIASITHNIKVTIR